MDSQTQDGRSGVPDARDVAAALKAHPNDCAYVRHVPGGKLVDPAEIWIEPLSVWVRADGWSICADSGRGYSYPNLIGQRQIRAAVRAWRIASGIEARSDETRSGSAVGNGPAPQGDAQNEAEDHVG